MRLFVFAFVWKQQHFPNTFSVRQPSRPCRLARQEMLLEPSRPPPVACLLLLSLLFEKFLSFVLSPIYLIFFFLLSFMFYLGRKVFLLRTKHQCLIQILIIKKTHFILQAQIESTTNFVILLSNRSACFTFVAKKTFDQSNLFT